MEKTIDKLNTLSQLNAIASNEAEVSNYLKSTLESNYTSDRLGSIIASVGDGKKVLITAPMDEVGMIVSQVKPNGLIKFQSVGPMISKNALNQLFTITTKDKTFLATLISKPFSVQTKDELSKVDDLKSTYLDAGFTSDKEVFKKGIQIGDMVTRYSPFNTLENDRYMSKALDSRTSVYVLSKLINSIKSLKVQLHAAFTVQHKMSMKGAKTSSFMVEPDLAISLDTIEVTDQACDNLITLGAGPVIFFYDQGLIAHPKLRNFILDICKKHKIIYQEAHQLSGFNEGHYLQLSKIGAATISIGIPLRNKNSHNQIVDLKDLSSTQKLLLSFLEALNDETINDILYN